MQKKCDGISEEGGLPTPVLGGYIVAAPSTKLWNTLVSPLMGGLPRDKLHDVPSMAEIFPGNAVEYNSGDVQNSVCFPTVSYLIIYGGSVRA